VLVQAVVGGASRLPSGAEALVVTELFGTTEVLPFQNTIASVRLGEDEQMEVITTLRRPYGTPGIYWGSFPHAEARG